MYFSYYLFGFVAYEASFCCPVDAEAAGVEAAFCYLDCCYVWVDSLARLVYQKFGLVSDAGDFEVVFDFVYYVFDVGD